jgi:hypothetical protein
MQWVAYNHLTRVEREAYEKQQEEDSHEESSDEEEEEDDLDNPPIVLQQPDANEVASPPWKRQCTSSEVDPVALHPTTTTTTGDELAVEPVAPTQVLQPLLTENGDGTTLLPQDDPALLDSFAF